MNYYNEGFTTEMKSEKKFETNMHASACPSEATDYDGGMGMMAGCSMMPVYECPQERVCHRYICYEVPHIMPCNTRIINHHIYRHTFTPQYTCCEENVVSNIYDRNCCM